MIAQAATIPPLDLTKYGKSPFAVEAVHHVAKSVAALPAYIEEADLDDGVPMMYREDETKIRMAYDPKQITGVQARTMLAAKVLYTEVPAAAPDTADGRAPLEPATDCYSVTATGAAGALLSAEIFRSDDENNPRTTIAVWSEPRAEDDLDVAGADQLLADLEEFLPRLRDLRNHLATVEAGQ